MDFSQLNILAILLAALSAFMLGGIWYSPLLFQRTWMEGCGLTELDLKDSDPKWIFGGSFVLSLIMAFSLSLFIGPHPTLGVAVGAGFAIGICWVSSSFGMSYIFEQRPLKLFLVNSGYHVLQFTLMGLVLGMWP
ncbi:MULTISPECIES: DUF1761 domain-containing protein [Pseudoalteromonas]|uniref:DUF1761 domain-containing protein n=1 Tax=Pseudoalteromonas TaxID=53246 RepID=UPI0007DB26E2|nr:MULTISPECIES: DUF1761 domain-containing protein [Pseudoalteromonas]NMR26072.1 DUF1761 domain-containing protein [Pseudoalteromonas sp. NEC-BIFX-2020_015]